MKQYFLRSPIGYLFLFIIISWLILAVVFGIFDLNISLSVVDENSLWGDFGAKFGEAPGYGLISITLTTLIGGYIKDIKKQKIPGYFSILIGIFYMIYAIIENNEEDILLSVFLIIPIALFIIFTWNKDWRNYRSISAIITILAILNPLLFVQITKLFFGRVRFRDLALDYSNFSPWYIPQGVTGNYSFPSGHAAMGWMFLPLLILVRELQWKDIRKIIVILLVIGWGLFVVLSRIVVGAHYASDVLFPTEFAAIITILFYRKFFVK